MIYVAVIVAICLAELLIRRYINQNVGEDRTETGENVVSVCENITIMVWQMIR